VRPIVPLIDKTIDASDWGMWSWVEVYGRAEPGPTGFNLNLEHLNTWAGPVISEVHDVLGNLGLRASLIWHMELQYEFRDYRLALFAKFPSDSAAVAFKLAWEPESAPEW
jgi:hypothetical protein